MVYFHSSISVCNSVDQSSTATAMANSVNFSELHPKPKHRNHGMNNHNRKINNNLSFPACDGCRSAVIDVLILIAVIVACGFLLFPYIKVVAFYLIKFVSIMHYVVKEEILRNPTIYASIGLGSFCAAMAVWIVFTCTSRKCGNPNCKGLRKAAEFDIQLESEDCVKNSNGNPDNDRAKDLFELRRDHHRELEAELKKMAPPNGRAVLLFRARCGCSVGRLEVPGPKKIKRIKK